jgi:hypothetical protein
MELALCYSEMNLVWWVSIGADRNPLVLPKCALLKSMWKVWEGPTSVLICSPPTATNHGGFPFQRNP